MTPRQPGQGVEVIGSVVEAGHVAIAFAARVQDAHRGPNPVLIRIETQSGHGSSSLTKQIAEMADEYAFIFENLGVIPMRQHHASARVAESL